MFAITRPGLTDADVDSLAHAHARLEKQTICKNPEFVEALKNSVSVRVSYFYGEKSIADATITDVDCP